MFEPLPANFNFPEAERKVLNFWTQHDIFGKSLEIRRGSPRFIFYEGPPTANGMPHPGHCLTRAIKDLFPRYQTMCGKLVERKAGWDTHGLPVEVEVCKELGIHTKEEIEAYGVEKFVHKCIQSVFKYTREWEEMTRRLGFWVNLEDAYVTFHQSYVESVWWSLKTLFERGLLYQGHKIVWWWCQGGTALSAGEVGEGYRTVEDPSVYIRFPLVSEPERERGAFAGSIDKLEWLMKLKDEFDFSVPDEDAKRIQSVAEAEEYVRTRHPELWQRAVTKGVIGGRGPDLSKVPPGAKISLLVWTTTPWTLISNHFAAVGPDIDYSLVHDQTTNEYLYIATALVNTAAEKVKHKLEPVGVCKGTDLLGLRYVPPFDCYHKAMKDRTAALKAGGEAHIGWRVLPADFVTLDSGTGLVHEAPAFGEVDFNLLQEERQRFVDLDAIPLINAVAPDGMLTAEAGEKYQGRWVKDADKDIIRELRDRGILYHQELYKHEYPFCPRAEDDPLIQYARKSWFVRTSQFKDEMLANNWEITWLPREGIKGDRNGKGGRFGDFLANNVDWALSRERYWGTPLPIWVCEKTGKMEAIGSYAELLAKPGVEGTEVWEAAKRANPDLPDHLRVHKPYIDEVTYQSPFDPGARMRRVPEVIDCWWDAGSMPFAQWGYPHTPDSIRTFIERFPADFISEAVDQTRGWFYGLLAISTLLFSSSDPEDYMPGAKSALTRAVEYPHPYSACIVLGHVMGEDGLKMSKRTKNYKEPSYIFDTYGADPMRWYFFSVQAPWTDVKFQEANIRDAHREFLLRLYNVFSFFNIYANIDGFVAHPQHGSPWRPTAQRCELDRWIVSELNLTIRFVRESLDRFENYPAAGRINEFVDALSNWYVRRSRDRFWRGEKDQDKWDAYHTLYGVLYTLSKLIAPFTPFFAETMYQNLQGAGIKGTREQGATHAGASGPPELDPSIPRSLDPLSVHLCDYPLSDEALIDGNLAAQMDLVRQIVSLGRSARTDAKLKVRQPLALVEIILARSDHTDWLAAHADLIADELNIKQVEFSTEADHYVTYQLKADFKAIGPKFGQMAPKIAAALAKLDAAIARQTLTTTGELSVPIDGQPTRLTDADVQIRLQARPGWSAAQGRAGVVVVKTELTPELKEEGVVRELIHALQALRKEQELPYEARIVAYVEGPAELLDVVRRFDATFRRECLAERIEFAIPAGVGVQTAKIESYAVRLAIAPL